MFKSSHFCIHQTNCYERCVIETQISILTKSSRVEQSLRAYRVQVKVGRSLRGPVTVSTQEPFRREQFPKGRVAFEVAMPRKDCRTAVGFVGLPESTSAYLTPDYLPKVNTMCMHHQSEHHVHGLDWSLQLASQPAILANIGWK